MMDSTSDIMNQYKNSERVDYSAEADAEMNAYNEGNPNYSNNPNILYRPLPYNNPIITFC